MLKIALTGPSGSGKGHVCALFRARGIPCLDTDVVVHRLYELPEFSRTVAQALDEDVLSEKGTINRKKLALLAYGSQEKMRTLLSIVYPAVRQECLSFFEDAQKQGCSAAVIDAPQLFESGIDRDCDLILAVYAPKALRVARVMRRDGISRKDALLRMSHQKSAKEYARLSHGVIRNGNDDDPGAQIDELLRKNAAT